MATHTPTTLYKAIQAKNVPMATAAFNNIIRERMREVVSSEYRVAAKEFFGEKMGRLAEGEEFEDITRAPLTEGSYNTGEVATKHGYAFSRKERNPEHNNYSEPSSPGELARDSSNDDLEFYDVYTKTGFPDIKLWSYMGNQHWQLGKSTGNLNNGGLEKLLGAQME